MALFKISKGLAANLAKNVPNAKEGFAYFTSDDGKFYIDTAGDGTTATPAVVGTNRIPLNAYASDVLKAGEMSTTDGVVYPILAFKITDTAKNLVEAKYGKIGFKNGTLVIPNLDSHDEMYITNEGDGRALVIEKLKGPTIGNGPGSGIEIKSETDTYAIEVTGKSKGIKVTQDPTDNLELTTKQYVDTSTANKQDKITVEGILKGDGNGGVSAAVAGTDYRTDVGLVYNENNQYYEINASNVGLSFGNPAGYMSITAGEYSNTYTALYLNALGADTSLNDLCLGTPNYIGDGLISAKDTTTNSVKSGNVKLFDGALAISSENFAVTSITGIPTPTEDSGAANKAYVDQAIDSALTDDALNLKAGNAIDIEESGSNITIGVKDGVFANVSHNHDDNYVKKTGDEMTGALTIDCAGRGVGIANDSTNYIELARDNAGLQLYGLWDYLKNSWIVRSDGSTVLFDNYPITINGTRGIPVVTSDYGTIEIGQHIDFHQNGTQNYNGRLSCQEDWNFIGKNKLYLTGSTTTAADLPTVLYFGSKDTDTGVTDYSYIATYSGHRSGNYGGKMVINGGQGLIIGSGESAINCYANVLKSVNTEDMYVTSDTNIYFYTNCNTWANHTTAVKIDTAGKLYGAVWNDYAEMREGDTIEAGKCVIEVGDDTLKLSSERMQPGANITSDTFGFAIGETDKCKTPIAVSGRVLAYGYEDREEFRKNIGRPVCSGPNGTVSIMTDEEYKENGYCAIGTISAVPDYEEWGTGNVKVDGRIWIKVI